MLKIHFKSIFGKNTKKLWFVSLRDGTYLYRKQKFKK